MADEIEFFDAGSARGGGEPLPEPARRRWPGTPRSHGLALVALALVLVGGGVILRASTTGTPDASEAPATAARTAPPSGVATPHRADSVDALSTPAQIFCGNQVTPALPGAASVAPSSVSRTDLDPGRIDGLVVCDPHDAASCGQVGAGSANCTTTGEIPMQVVAAVRQRFPGVRYLGSQSQVLNNPLRLFYRYVELGMPDRRIRIQVLIQQRADSAGFSGNLDNGTMLIVRSVHTGADLATIVQVTGPSGTRPDDAVAADLAADPRLAAVG